MFDGYHRGALPEVNRYENSVLRTIFFLGKVREGDKIWWIYSVLVGVSTSFKSILLIV